MEKITLQAGMVTKSLKGHDKDRIYLVATIVNSEFALVVDGVYRKMSNPKLKRIKHLKILFDKDKKPNVMLDKFEDVKIKRFIKNFAKANTSGDEPQK